MLHWFNGEEDIEDNLSYDEISYESGDSMFIADVIAGVENDSEPIWEMNNGIAEPFDGKMDGVSVTTWESLEVDIKEHHSNISVPEACGTGTMHVVSSPFNEVQPGRDIIPGSV